jgi:hypothetical protein
MPAAMKPGATWLSHISSRGLASFFPFLCLKVPGFRTNVTFPVRQSVPEESICLVRGADGRAGVKGCPVHPWRAHDDSYGTAPRCRNVRMQPVSGRSSALRCTASDAVRGFTTPTRCATTCAPTWLSTSTTPRRRWWSTELVRVAGRCWTVEETFQAGKGLAGPDEHQVRRWPSWHRWVTLAMLAHAFLSVAAATERRASRTRRPRPAHPQRDPAPVHHTDRAHGARRVPQPPLVAMATPTPSPGPQLPLPTADGRAVADAVRLVDRLLQHIATPGADALEGGVAVVGPEDDSAQQAPSSAARLSGNDRYRVRSGASSNRSGASSNRRENSSHGVPEGLGQVPT